MNTTSPRNNDNPEVRAFENAYREFRDVTRLSVIEVTSAQDEDADDAVQTAALSVWQLVSGGRSDKPIKAFRTYWAKSAIHAHCRAQAENWVKPSEEALEKVDPAAENAKERELWERRRAWLPGAIRRLPEGERNVVTLRLENRCNGEISKRLGLADFTVPVIHSRAVARLRRFAREDGLMGDSKNLTTHETIEC